MSLLIDVRKITPWCECRERTQNLFHKLLRNAGFYFLNLTTRNPSIVQIGLISGYVDFLRHNRHKIVGYCYLKSMPVIYFN